MSFLTFYGQDNEENDTENYQKKYSQYNLQLCFINKMLILKNFIT